MNGDLFDKLEADYEAGKHDWPDEVREAYWRRQEMPKYEKAKAGEARERADWVKGMYVVALKEARLVPNQFYQDEDKMIASYGPRHPDGYWLNKKGEKKYADWPEDEQQWELDFEVIDGDRKGDWFRQWLSPRFGLKKGGWFGRLAAFIDAVDHSALPGDELDTGPWALVHDGDLDEFVGKPLAAVIVPKENPQNAKVTEWLPVPEKYDAPKDEPLAEEDIPF